MNSCVVIPYFNHGGAIAGVLESVRALGLPCWVVDDGSDADSKTALARAVGANERVLTLPRNQGKGAAVMAGCDAALAAGYTHALQIDADGQHSAADVPRLLAAARAQPQAIVIGQPLYDESVPRARRYGRYATRVWVWINTLSFDIEDSMCGLRVYPLDVVTPLWRRSRFGKRMDFDTEVLVRAAWTGATIVNIPTRVTYPADGVSHFKLLLDNALISWMHCKLFFGMLARAPFILSRRVVRRRKDAA